MLYAYDRWGALAILSLTTLGHMFFTLAMVAGSYPWALVGRALFGLGQGSTVVAQVWRLVGRQVLIARESIKKIVLAIYIFACNICML